MSIAPNPAFALALLLAASPAIADPESALSTLRSIIANDFTPATAVNPELGVTPFDCVSAADCAQPGDFAMFLNISVFDTAEVMEFAETGALRELCTTFVFAGGPCPASPSQPEFVQTWSWEFFGIDANAVPDPTLIARFDTESPLANLQVESFFIGTIGAGFPVLAYTFTLGNETGGTMAPTGFPVEAGTCYALKPKFALEGCSAFWETSTNIDGSTSGDGFFLQDALADGFDVLDYAEGDLALCLDILTMSPRCVAATLSCPGDCNADGVVDFNDLVSMLFEFQVANPFMFCDPNDSGDVDFDDLVTALLLFGPCP